MKFIAQNNFVCDDVIRLYVSEEDAVKIQYFSLIQSDNCPSAIVHGINKFGEGVVELTARFVGVSSPVQIPEGDEFTVFKGNPVEA